jgi:hypothetical protein
VASGSERRNPKNAERRRVPRGGRRADEVRRQQDTDRELLERMRQQGTPDPLPSSDTARTPDSRGQADSGSKPAGGDEPDSARKRR